MIYGSPRPVEKEESDSELHLYHQDQNLQLNSGLLRFRSAPSSLFAELAGAAAQRSSQFQPPDFVSSQPAGPFSSSPAMVYNHPVQTHLLNHGLALAERSNHKEMQQQQLEIGVGRKSSNLARQSSTPAGFFSHLNSDNGTISYFFICRNEKPVLFYPQKKIKEATKQRVKSSKLFSL